MGGLDLQKVQFCESSDEPIDFVDAPVFEKPKRDSCLFNTVKLIYTYIFPRCILVILKPAKGMFAPINFHLVWMVWNHHVVN